jgi:hypothetical protein
MYTEYQGLLRIVGIWAYADTDTRHQAEKKPNI